MPSYTANGLVVHRHDLGEYDRILTLFTREQGKLSAVAKGARRPKSRVSGATDLFTYSRFLLGTGKNLDVVSQCEIAESFPDLRYDLERLARATYICELLDRMTLERDAMSSDALFDLSIAALTLLSQATNYPDGVIHAYELRLLAIVGYAPVLDHCVKCGTPLDNRQVGFSPLLGGTLCTDDRYKSDDAVTVSHEAVLLLQSLVIEDVDLLLSLTPGSKACAEVDRALRWFVRTRVNRDLKSGDFLDQLRAGR